VRSFTLLLFAAGVAALAGAAAVVIANSQYLPGSCSDECQGGVIVGAGVLILIVGGLGLLTLAIEAMRWPRPEQIEGERALREARERLAPWD
jgi:hypothetical protein